MSKIKKGGGGGMKSTTRTSPKSNLEIGLRTAELLDLGPRQCKIFVRNIVPRKQALINWRIFVNTSVRYVKTSIIIAKDYFLSLNTKDMNL